MKKVIKVRLDPQSIEAAINELNAYKQDLERRVQMLLEELTDRGVQIARAKVVEHHIIHDTQLSSSINGYVSPLLGVGFVRVTDEHAVFFEFGTGPVGASNPHPSGTGIYCQDGWYTKADDKPMDMLYGWQPLVTDNGDIIYYTKGQKAKPFMYETALRLRDEFPSIVKGVFG